MKYMSLKLPESYLEGLDKLIMDGVYHCRSEAVRSAIRVLLKWEGIAHLSKVYKARHILEEKKTIQTKKGDTYHKEHINGSLPPKEVIEFFLRKNGEYNCKELPSSKTSKSPAKMKTLQIKLPRMYIKALDITKSIGLYPSKSKAVRVAIKNLLKQEKNLPFSKIYEALDELDRKQSSLPFMKRMILVKGKRNRL
ncbi:MAG: hypothetical protein ACFFCD_07870 [Promethearchaeota archaeon]